MRQFPGVWQLALLLKFPLQFLHKIIIVQNYSYIHLALDLEPLQIGYKVPDIILLTIFFYF